MISSSRRASTPRKALCALVLSLVCVTFGGANQARAELLYGLVGGTNAVTNGLVKFDSNAPGSGTSFVMITGVNGFLRDIDFRPATGALYALSDTDILYTINTTSGIATQASVLNASTAGNGDFFGIDFNPTVDRLRVVNNAGQNLRVNVDTGSVIRDAALSKNGVIAAAYTNNFAGALSTTLYDLSVNSATSRLELNTQTPPNAGVVNFVGATDIPATFLAGFDISGVTGTAYAATTGDIGGARTSTLYSINLATGASTNLGLIGFENGLFIRGLAAPVGPAAAVPEPATLAMFGFGMVGLALFVRRSRAVVAAS